MKIHQLICKSFALVLLTALPSFAETNNKVILVPGENLFSIKCETIQGSIDANDRVDPPGSLNDFESRYDSYSIKDTPGNIVFFKLTTPNDNKPNFNIRLTTKLVDKKTGALLGRSSSSPTFEGVGDVDETWYFPRKATETTNRTLYISSATFSRYNLRIASVRPSNTLSESQIEKAIIDLKKGGSLEEQLTGKSPHSVDMNALCKN